MLGKLPPNNYPTLSSPIEKHPPPYQRSKMAERIKDAAPATGYGSSWVPPSTEVPERQSEPRFNLGRSTTYIANPSELPVVKSSESFKNARPAYVR
jgi:hypothetical protein